MLRLLIDAVTVLCVRVSVCRYTKFKKPAREPNGAQFSPVCCCCQSQELKAEVLLGAWGRGGGSGGRLHTLGDEGGGGQIQQVLYLHQLFINPLRLFLFCELHQSLT